MNTPSKPLPQRGKRLRSCRAALMKLVRRQLTSVRAGGDDTFLDDATLERLKHEVAELVAIEAALHHFQAGLGASAPATDVHRQ